MSDEQLQKAKQNLEGVIGINARTYLGEDMYREFIEAIENIYTMGYEDGINDI